VNQLATAVNFQPLRILAGIALVLIVFGANRILNELSEPVSASAPLITQVEPRTVTIARDLQAGRSVRFPGLSYRRWPGSIVCSKDGCASWASESGLIRYVAGPAQLARPRLKAIIAEQSSLAKTKTKKRAGAD